MRIKSKMYKAKFLNGIFALYYLLSLSLEPHLYYSRGRTLNTVDIISLSVLTPGPMVGCSPISVAPLVVVDPAGSSGPDGLHV